MKIRHAAAAATASAVLVLGAGGTAFAHDGGTSGRGKATCEQIAKASTHVDEHLARETARLTELQEKLVNATDAKVIKRIEKKIRQTQRQIERLTSRQAKLGTAATDKGC